MLTANCVHFFDKKKFDNRPRPIVQAFNTVHDKMLFYRHKICMKLKSFAHKKNHLNQAQKLTQS